MSFIYKITNEVNRKVYIGQTNNYRRRKIEHLHKFNDSIISKAIQKYGADCFTFEILVILPENKIDDAEREAIIKYNSLHPNGYNLETGGHFNKTCCEETRKKISKIWKGRKQTEEHKRKISIANKGKKPAEITIQKSLLAHKGKKLSEETKLKMSLAHKNISQDTRNKMSKSHKGKVIPEEVKLKISNSNKGKSKIITMETRKKIAIANTGKKHSEETKLRMSIIAKERERLKRERK